MKLLLFLMIASCSKRSPAPPDVKVWGALREMIHDGRVEGRVELASVVGPSVVGLGALEGMRGEVTILDGAAWVAIGTRDGGRATKLVGDQRAALLVAATVPAWRRVVIESDIAASALDARIEQYIAAAGLPVDQPIPFRIEGEVGTRWHVLEGPPAPGSSPHDHTRNAVTGRFDGTATIVGFYSKHHVGVFTHMGHTVHAHILEPRTALSAHADELMVKAGSVLELPE